MYEPSATEGPAVSVFNAWASAHFLHSLAPERLLTPQCYGGDRATGTLVFQDIGTNHRLDHVLLGTNDVTAETSLHTLATTLGHIHALTAGQQAAFDTLRRTFGPRAHQRPLYTDAFVETLERATAVLGIEPNPAAITDLHALIDAINTPGPFEVLTHGDICLDNCQYVDDQVVLLDFEGGSYGPALLDGVFARVCFPSCWCVGQLPHRIVDAVTTTYRTAFVSGCPAAGDERLFVRAEVEACLYWTLSLCTWIPIADLLAQDWSGGERDTGTARQRILTRFEIVALVTQHNHYLEALGATFQVMAERLQHRWPQEAAGLRLFPALATE